MRSAAWHSASLAGVVYGLACGFDPGGTVFDMQMNVLKLQCAGECIEITGDAFDVGGAELPWLGEFQMFNDASIRLSYNAGLERFLQFCRIWQPVRPILW